MFKFEKKKIDSSFIENKNNNFNNEDEISVKSNSSKNESKIYEKKEIIIIWSLLVVFLAVLVSSICFILINDSECYTVYLLIAMTGSLNYFLNFYYSNQEVEFISLSGFIALAQLIFRLLEIIFERFDSNLDYLWQIIGSFAGLIFSIIYLCCLRKIKETDNEEKEFKEQNNAIIFKENLNDSS